MPLIKIEELAAMLNCDLHLSFTPRIEDPDDRDKYIDNPKPWTCRKIDYSDNRGSGATPDEACGALVESMLQRARKYLAEATESQKSSAAHLEKMVNLLAGGR